MVQVRAERRATIFVLDGASPEVFAYLVDRGDLPNVSRHLLEPGGQPSATTVFPSTTGVAYLPFLTGCYPGTCNVPGIRWLDRARYEGHWWRDRAHLRSYCGPQASLLNSDLSDTIPTLFDLEPDSVALCSPFTRGVDRGRDHVRFARLLFAGFAHFTGAYGIVDRSVGHSLRQVARERHQLVFAVFPGVDGITHFFDPWHPIVLDMYRQFDHVVGQYVARGGFDGDHLAVIVSDHGASRVDTHTDLSIALEEIGIPVLRHPFLLRSNPKAAVMVSGNGSAQVYFQPGVPREARWSPEEIESGEVPGLPPGIVGYLTSLEGVALVAGTEGSDIVVYSREGRARLAEVGDDVRYAPETADVLGVSQGSRTRTDRQWLDVTYRGPFPDSLRQLLQVFRSHRAGDLVVASALGADLRKEWEIPEHRSGHGSLIAEHMRCLLVSNRTLRSPVRTVDVFPLVLEHLGRAVPREIDGVSPIPAQTRELEVAWA